ncbi:MAG: DnaD domain protein [Chloroflexota bacterium]|nr:DnaD domain protein [Chloroflexota bacterium]MDE2970602.1 DnaD domain protein [Chloroflexota bacterium]
MAADGRPSDVVPVPTALFGPLLERVTDAATLRCALRAIFVLHRKQSAPGRGRGPSTVTAAELAADPVLALGGDESAAERGLAALAEVGVLVRAESGYCLDTAANRRALASMGELDGEAGRPSTVSGRMGVDQAVVGHRPDVFRLYEENIGVITPMAAERLKDMEEEYPSEWIAEAFGQAVVSNARSLRYVEAVLRRWRDDGRGDGTAGGRAGAVRASEIVRRPRR